MQNARILAVRSGILAYVGLLIPISAVAESRLPLKAAVGRFVLIVKCKFEVRDNLVNYRVTESWKGKYSPSLFVTEPPEGYLYPYWLDPKVSPIIRLKDGQEAIFFFMDNAVSRVKEKEGKIRAHDHDDVFVVENGKVVYVRNSLPEMFQDRDVYTLTEFRKAILAAGPLKESQNEPDHSETIPAPESDPWVGAYLKYARYDTKRTGTFGEAQTITITKDRKGYSLCEPYADRHFNEVEKGVLSDGPGGFGKIYLGSVEYADGKKISILRVEFCYEDFVLYRDPLREKPRTAVPTRK